MTLWQVALGRVTPRQWAKYRLYALAGTFPYFGFRVHFPKGASAFECVCVQGIFEADNVGVLQRIYRPGTYMFDVGANLGLMALPVLGSGKESKVVSFEPSPNTLPWLKRTMAASGLGDRWRIVEKALGSTPGVESFSLSALAEGLYDGLKHTHRAPEVSRVQVEVTSLDKEWQALGRPQVSVIKIDVEGGELDVLRGAEECLSREKPYVLLEWSHLNLAAYGVPRDALFVFAQKHSYRLYALPEMIPLTTSKDLELQVLRTESFLMAPSSSPACA